MEVNEMKVKDFPNWKKVVFNDRAILKADTKFMSWEQIRALDNLEVIAEEDKGRTLICKNRWQKEENML